MEYSVMSQAMDRKTGEPEGEARYEIINTNDNAIFQHCKTAQDVHKAFESHWNDLQPNSAEVVLACNVSRIEPVDGVSTYTLTVLDDSIQPPIGAEPAEPTEPPVDSGPHNYALVIAEIVRGRSKGPKGFTRYKPFKYTDADNSHPIVYAKVVDIELSQAKTWAAKVNSEMKGIFQSFRSDRGYIKSWGIVLYDVTDDKVVPFGPNDDLGNSGYLYDGTEASNEILLKWKIITPSMVVASATSAPSQGVNPPCPNCTNIILEEIGRENPHGGIVFTCPSCEKTYRENPVNPPVHFSTWELQKPKQKTSVISGRKISPTKAMQVMKKALKDLKIDVDDKYLSAKDYTKDGLKGVEIGIHTDIAKDKAFFRKLEAKMSKALEFEPTGHKFRANPNYKTAIYSKQKDGSLLVTCPHDKFHKMKVFPPKPASESKTTIKIGGTLGGA